MGGIMANWEFLKKMPLFKELSNRDLAVIGDLTIMRNYSKDTVVFMEAQQGEGFYYVQSGKVKILHTSLEGQEQIVHIVGPGEVFAEVLLFQSSGYPATAVALEDSQIGMIKNHDLEQAVLRYPQLALQLIKILSQKLLQAQQKITTLAFSDTSARTTENLIQLARQYGRQTEQGVEIDLSMTRQELANLVGTSRETVTRVLSAMKKSKMIDLVDHKIIILEWDKLLNR
jgi:CRP/FNR family transcriptional regulator, cyclic AMP receptor protein